MRFLVLGSTLEAAMALEFLQGFEGVEKIWHLPGGGGRIGVLAETPLPRDWTAFPTETVNRALIRDRWGKTLIKFKLPNYRVMEIPEGCLSRNGKVETLSPGTELLRTRRTTGEDGIDQVSCEFSDGSELVGRGVILADGVRSKGRELMKSVSPLKPLDARANACWTFVRQDLLSLEAWEFRSAPGKSVEQLPLPNGRVRVKLRFRTSVGSRLGSAELRDLFSEFGADMAALFENVPDENISYLLEETPVQTEFSPIPGSVALGQAGLGTPLLECFDWSSQMVKSQLERIAESLLHDLWDPEAWEPEFRDAQKRILRGERFLRGALHYENPLLRPLRDTVIRWLPTSLMASKVQERLALGC